MPPPSGGGGYDEILPLGEEIWIYEEKKLEWNKIAGYLKKVILNVLFSPNIRIFPPKSRNFPQNKTSLTGKTLTH